MESQIAAKAKFVVQFCLVTILITACVEKRLTDQSNTEGSYTSATGIRYNQYVGKLEVDIRNALGKPKGELTVPAKAMGDDLRYELKGRVSAKQKVKRLHFSESNNTPSITIWCVENESGVWKIIADRTVAPGIVF